MAKGNATAAMPDFGRLQDLRNRILFVLGALLVFRIGTFIPVPGIDPVQLEALFEQQSGTILDLGVMFTGGALERLSIFALGIMPYISASIIMQLMTAVTPSLKELRKEGESGRRKITKYTRYGTLALATFQAVGASVALQSNNIAIAPGPGFVFTATVSLVTGTMFLMWLGEQISERGIGNGISLLIFTSIVAGLPSALGGTAQMVSDGSIQGWQLLAIAAFTLGVTALVVYVERAQRRIPIHYARRQQGRRVYAAPSQHMPLKLNMAGVIPPIFASSLILFPASMVRFFGEEGGGLVQTVANTLSPGQPLYVLLYAMLIVFFCFFYTAIVFDSKDTADNLKRSNAYVPGVRPGRSTAQYIDKVLTRLTVVGAAYITAVCLLPEFLILGWNVPFYFGGTSLLIIVVVVMDFMAQLQAHMMSHQYDGLLKKANLKGNGRTSAVRS
nr:preprotein translocase subunit SecY [Oceanococcus sp. HetDA_MAG_MS8]